MNREEAHIDFAFKGKDFIVRITTASSVEEVVVTPEIEAVVLETLMHRAAKDKVRKLVRKIELDDIINRSCS